MAHEGYVFYVMKDLLIILTRMIHDPNDPEFQESLKYLALPAEEKLKLRSQPFDAKKACWVPDPKESFIAAEIESTKDDQVTVKTSKGEVYIYFIRYSFEIIYIY